MTSNRRLVPWLVLVVALLVSVPELFAKPPVGSNKAAAAGKLPGYKLSATRGGYMFNVSPRVMGGFPAGAKVTLKVTLDDPVEGKTTITGTVVRVSATSFKLVTNEKLRFRATPGRTWVLMLRSGRTPGIGGPGTCGGCPHSSDPPMDHVGEGMCMCWAEAAPRPAVNPGVTRPTPITKLFDPANTSCGASAGGQ